jgi:hypothetical protein
MQTNFQFGRRTGVPRQVGNIQITPESMVLLVYRRNFGYVWNWPIAVSVARLNGHDGADAGGDGALPGERHAIVDVTRLLLWSMWAATLIALLAAVLGPFFLRARKRKAL